MEGEGRKKGRWAVTELSRGVKSSPGSRVGDVVVAMDGVGEARGTGFTQDHVVRQVNVSVLCCVPAADAKEYGVSAAIDM